MALRPVAACVALLGVAVSCGGGASPHPSSPPTQPAATATAVPTPSPTAADDESVTLVAAGLGAYLETTVPVAVVRSRASSHSAIDVVVRFTVVDGAGRGVAETVAHIPSLGPGQVGAAAGRAAVVGTGDTVRTELQVTRWQAGSVATVTATASGCAGCPARGSGYGTVHAALGVGGGPPQATVTAVAVCYAASGGVAGGGGAVAPTAPSVDVPVIVSQPVARCEAYAAPGGFGGF